MCKKDLGRGWSVKCNECKKWLHWHCSDLGENGRWSKGFSGPCCFEHKSQTVGQVFGRRDQAAPPQNVTPRTKTEKTAPNPQNGSRLPPADESMTVGLRREGAASKGGRRKDQTPNTETMTQDPNPQTEPRLPPTDESMTVGLRMEGAASEGRIREEPIKHDPQLLKGKQRRRKQQRKERRQEKRDKKWHDRSEIIGKNKQTQMWTWNVQRARVAFPKRNRFTEILKTVAETKVEIVLFSELNEPQEGIKWVKARECFGVLIHGKKVGFFRGTAGPRTGKMGDTKERVVTGTRQ